jgi:hypothetical protein
MSKRFDRSGLPEDKATYARWRRGAIILYCSIGLVVVAVIAAAHWSRLVDQLAADLPASPDPPCRATPAASRC